MSTFPLEQKTLTYVIDVNSFPMNWFKDQTYFKFVEEIRAAVTEVQRLGIFEFKEAFSPKEWKEAVISFKFEKMDATPQDPRIFDKYGVCRVTTDANGRRIAQIRFDSEQQWTHKGWYTWNPWSEKIHFRAVVLHELLHALGWTEHTPEDVRDFSIMAVGNAGGYCKTIPRYDQWHIRKIYGLA